MSDNVTELSAIALRLEPLCAHVSLREYDSVPYLFAVGKQHVHSLELRRQGCGLVLELWRGPPNADKFIRKETPASLEEAYAQCDHWLRNDAL